MFYSVELFMDFDMAHMGQYKYFTDDFLPMKYSMYLYVLHEQCYFNT